MEWFLLYFIITLYFLRIFQCSNYWQTSISTTHSHAFSLFELVFKLLDLSLQLLHFCVELGVHCLDFSADLVGLRWNLLAHECLDVLDLSINLLDFLFKFSQFFFVLFKLWFGVLVFFSFFLEPVQLLQLFLDVHVSAVFNGFDFFLNFSDLLLILLDLSIKSLYLLFDLLLISHCQEEWGMTIKLNI